MTYLQKDFSAWAVRFKPKLQKYIKDPKGIEYYFQFIHLN